MTGNEKVENTPAVPGPRGPRRGFWCGLAVGSIALAACQAALQPAERRETVELSLLTPDAGWEFRVREVRETPEEVWVWAELEREKGAAAQMMTTVRTEVDLPAGKPHRVFVTGKTWAWENEEPYTFVTRAPAWPRGARPIAPSAREEAEDDDNATPTPVRDR